MFSKVSLDIDAFILITNPLSELSLGENDALHQSRPTDRLTNKQSSHSPLTIVDANGFCEGVFLMRHGHGNCLGGQS